MKLHLKSYLQNLGEQPRVSDFICLNDKEFIVPMGLLEAGLGKFLAALGQHFARS
ncbi:MAG: hypothetical protein JWO89_3272 [Verrucomicrobiaceae bacterium]|nr:hypothetical protein [Verrucomicrobiaceae bacterium]